MAPDPGVPRPAHKERHVALAPYDLFRAVVDDYHANVLGEWPTLDALMAMLLEAGYRATISTSRGGYWASVERIDDPEPLDARHFASSARRALLRASGAALRGAS